MNSEREKNIHFTVVMWSLTVVEYFNSTGKWNYLYGKDEYCIRSKHIKGSKERYLLGQNTTRELSGQSPLSSYKNDAWKS